MYSLVYVHVKYSVCNCVMWILKIKTVFSLFPCGLIYRYDMSRLFLKTRKIRTIKNYLKNQNFKKKPWISKSLILDSGIYSRNFADLRIDILYDTVFSVINLFCIIFVCTKDFNTLCTWLKILMHVMQKSMEIFRTNAYSTSARYFLFETKASKD